MNKPTITPVIASDEKSGSLDAVFRNLGSRKLSIWRLHNHDEEFSQEQEEAFKSASASNARHIANVVKEIGAKLEAKL